MTPDFAINDLVEDNEGDRAVIRRVDPLALEWDCRPGQVVVLDPSFRSQLTNLSAIVRELDSQGDRGRAEEIAAGERDGSVFVLFMRAQNVRDHFDGDAERLRVLDGASDEEIEALLGDELFYNAWHDMCRDVVEVLKERRKK